MNESNNRVRTIILRVTNKDYERISKWKKKGESWEAYILGLVELIERDIYRE